ncbi:hypothetical protein K439DRAFT_557769 [Ramaria rubella]|nr:hypothetical protein K439DRAFT_557769 [Ramaria rubella]
MDEGASPSHKRLYEMSPTSSPTRTPPRKIQRLETVRLSISEEQHAEQDQLVLEALAFSYPVLPEELDLRWATLLLSQIISTAGDQMDRTYAGRPSKLQEFLRTHNLLLDELHEAWSKKRFAAIRCIQILQNPSLVTKTPSPKTSRRLLNSDVHSLS